jgi:hypothetical protein
MRRQPQLWFGTAVTTMLLACGSDPLTPGQLSGLYRLTLTDGHAPPQVVDTTTLISHLYLRTGLLLIKSSGEDTLLARMDRGNFVTAYTWDYAGTYTLTGRTLNFTTAFSDGSVQTYPGTAGAQSIDIDVPFLLVGTFERYMVSVKTHFEQVCAGDQCNFNSDGPPWIRE